MKKIVVIGPESTGKSTLSRALAEALGGCWVPEFARGYLETLGRPYTEGDLLTIAHGQVEAEDRIAGAGPTPVVCDTDLYVLKVWSEHRYGRCDPWILREIARRSYDLYLLADIDLPWSDDPQREYPEPRMRAYFYRVYRDIVEQSGVPWALVRGEGPERLRQALAGLARARLR